MNKTILVTGGSRGIGAATARLAAERGYAVCVNYQRSSKPEHQGSASSSTPSSISRRARR